MQVAKLQQFNEMSKLFCFLTEHLSAIKKTYLDVYAVRQSR